MSVVPFSRHTWDSMIANSATYAPLVVRLVGFYMLHDHRGDPDHDPGGALAVASIPGIAALTTPEQDFVLAAAMSAYYHQDVETDVRAAYRAWIDEGAPQ